MRRIFLLLCFISSLGLHAGYYLNYAGDYKLFLKLDQPGLVYSNESSVLKLNQDGSIEVTISYKMVDPKTEKTNYVNVTANGSGHVNGSYAEIHGNGTITAVETGGKDDVMPMSLDITGDFSINNGVYSFLGTFSYRDGSNGEPVNGRVTGSGESINMKGVKVNITMGNYKIKRMVSDQWQIGKEGEPLGIGDKIETDSISRVNLVFPDGSVFKVKTKTLLEIENEAVKINWGEMEFEMEKQGSTFQVVVPSACIGDLGTKYIVSVEKSGETFVNLLEGKVFIQNNTGKRLTLDAGQSVIISPAGVIGTPEKIDTTEVRQNFDNSNSPSLGRSGKSSISNTTWIIIGSSAALVILLLIIIISLNRSKKRKRAQFAPPPHYNVPPPYGPPPVVQTPYIPNAGNMNQPNIVNTPGIKPATLIFCDSCGVKLKENARFCHICGKTF